MKHHDQTAEKSIVFLDLDGTLWLNERIPDSAVLAIEKARENGHLIFTNTGRSRDSAWRGLSQLPLNGQIYSLGSEIWLEHKQVFFEPLGAERTHRLLDELTLMDIGISVEGSESTFANWKAKLDLLGVMPVNESACFRFELLPGLESMKEKDFEGAMKLSLVDVEAGSLDDLLEREGMTFVPFKPVSPSGRIDGEITMRHMNKGTAFEILERLLPGSRRRIALGDSDNDVSMFAAADLAIAMGNGTPAAKEAADYVTAPIEQDGLYQAFAYAGLLD